MKTFGRLLALFLIMPVVELALLVQLERVISFWPTVGIIVFTGVLGTVMAKREGLAVWARFNDRLSTGALPETEVVDGIIILCAGALLITPGVITDVLGFIGLFPLTRSLVRKVVMKRISAYVTRQTQAFTYGVFNGPTASTFPTGQETGAWGGSGNATPEYVQRSVDEEQRR